MSLNKAVQYKKEHRKPYRGGKAVAHSCRNHGTCSFCSGNRLYHKVKEIDKADRAIQEYYKEHNTDTT